MRKIFITGTDTGVGKTYITSILLNQFKQQGYSTVGLKPVASGCDFTNDGLRNSDALALQKFSSMQLPYELI